MWLQHASFCILYFAEVAAFPREKSAAEGDRDAYGDPMLSLPQMILLLQVMRIHLLQVMKIPYNGIWDFSFTR